MDNPSLVLTPVNYLVYSQKKNYYSLSLGLFTHKMRIIRLTILQDRCKDCMR